MPPVVYRDYFEALQEFGMQNIPNSGRVDPPTPEVMRSVAPIGIAPSSGKFMMRSKYRSRLSLTAANKQTNAHTPGGPVRLSSEVSNRAAAR